MFEKLIQMASLSNNRLRKQTKFLCSRVFGARGSYFTSTGWRQGGKEEAVFLQVKP